MSNLIRRYMAIEVIINGKGQTQIPDQTQLRGCFIDGVIVLPSLVATVSAVTAKTNVATSTDLAGMTLSLVRASDNVIQNVPLLQLNPFRNNDSTNLIASQMLRELFLPQYIDWNQSSIYCGVTPSAASVIVSLGVYYYDPNKTIITG
jgi:hypothetical protein